MKNLTSILDWIRYTATKLADAENTGEIIFSHGSDTAINEAHALILGILNLPFDLDTNYFQAKLTHSEISQVNTALEKRIQQKKPSAYLSNRSLFMGLEFYVDERVLIPRSPIKELIQQYYQPYLDESIQVKSILDLCSGSGCIGIASAYAFPDAQVTLADISEDAIAVANINIAKHHLEHQVSAIQSDLFSQLTNQKFDIIVSNPPYVDQETMSELADEFKHEPALGLGSGVDGLDCTRRILKQASQYLTQEGILVVEVGASWDLLEEAFPEVQFNWYSFELGGEGVFIMTYDELTSYQDIFSNE